MALGSVPQALRATSDSRSHRYTFCEIVRVKHNINWIFVVDDFAVFWHSSDNLDKVSAHQVCSNVHCHIHRHYSDSKTKIYLFIRLSLEEFFPRIPLFLLICKYLRRSFTSYCMSLLCVVVVVFVVLLYLVRMERAHMSFVSMRMNMSQWEWKREYNIGHVECFRILCILKSVTWIS